MNYLEIRIYTDKCNLDPLTYILEDIGIAGFVVEDPDDLTEFLEKKNSYDWDYVDESVMELSKVKCNLCFYLDDSQEGKVQLENIRRQLNGCAMKNLDIHVTKVCDDTWKDNWKEYFKPSKITDRLVVKPTWEPYEKENSNQLVIEIDP
ncbi:MAG: 50S ribosomal protein L11 methyltransferase, partial [Anaerovorax sp.]